MRSSRPSNPPRRRALHERTPSETNEPCPSSSLRLVYDMDDSDNSDLNDNAYTSTPYPTKPEHVLLPVPGKGQEFVPASDESGEASGNSSTNLLSNSSVLDSSYMDQSIGDLDTSTIDAGNTPSQSWGDNPTSSRSSFPDTGFPKAGDRKDEHSDGSVDDEIIPLPTTTPTIKTIVAEPSSRQSPTTGPPSPADAASCNSSPNFVPIGVPSSPNFVVVDNSSMNVPIGASSIPDSGRSNSLESMTSFGTVVRHYNAAHWIHSSSPEHSISRSPSFRSSPPYQSVASVRSASIRGRGRSRSHSRSASSSQSGTPSEIQAIIDTGVFVQYPIIRAPSSSSSWVDTSLSSFPEDQVSVDSRPFRSHLSTVPSQLSGEYDSRVLSPVDESFDQNFGESSRPSAAMVRRDTSSAWLETEELDSLTRLPVRPTNPGVPSSTSSGSRNSSVKSNMRPGTGSSFILNTVPAWAKIYYRCDERTVNSALSLVENSRPSPARPRTPKPHVLGRMPNPLVRPGTNQTQPGTRVHDIRQALEPSPADSDPRDPRTHWVFGPEPDSPPSSPGLPASWSPHLYPDRKVVQTADTFWTAPSVDSAAEPRLGRRNIQVYLFCFGFICPFTWFGASFLRLPAKPEMDLEEPGPQAEFVFRTRLAEQSRRRYENARWWRNLNRWMTPLGVAIIVIIITLAAVGTTTGF